MDGWSALNTARTVAGDSTQDWDCRWWLLEERDLKSILEQIQFEGCFIFLPRISSDGGKYIFIADSYASATETLDEDDYTDLNFSLSPLSEIITDATYNYQKHPGKNAYILSSNYANASAKEDWFKNSANKENTKSFNLDFIASDSVYTSGTHSNANECVALYYDNILANPKILCSFNLINKAKYDLEIGDIFQLNDSDIDAFGYTSSVYYMVVKQRRSLNGMEILGRQVG